MAKRIQYAIVVDHSAMVDDAAFRDRRFCRNNRAGSNEAALRYRG